MDTNLTPTWNNALDAMHAGTQSAEQVSEFDAVTMNEASWVETVRSGVVSVVRDEMRTSSSNTMDNLCSEIKSNLNDFWTKIRVGEQNQIVHPALREILQTVKATNEQSIHAIQEIGQLTRVVTGLQQEVQMLRQEMQAFKQEAAKKSQRRKAMQQMFLKNHPKNGKCVSGANDDQNDAQPSGGGAAVNSKSPQKKRKVNQAKTQNVSASKN